MHVHALYVIGIGVFETVPTNDQDGKPSRKIRAWLGADRLARFGDVLRHTMDGWMRLGPGMSADLNAYLGSKPIVLREEDFK
jgi:hypothetical protein